MMKTMNKTLTLLLSIFLLALVANSTACIVVSEGDGGGWGDHHDDWDDWDDCECSDWNGECGDDDHDGHDHDDWGDNNASDNNASENNASENNSTPANNTSPENNDMGDDLDGDGVPDCPQPEQVCGEDGVTYDTACDASRAHVRVSHTGPCGEACLFDADCPVYEQCGGNGTCEPVSCTAEYEPVCGADGQTYGNACEAGAHHVAVSYDGECAPACQVDADCDLGSVCEGGRCEAANCPTVAEDDYSQEVCGEDGFTYASSCIARADHISIAHEGCCVE
jgi:hypothetical protein